MITRSLAGASSIFMMLACAAPPAAGSLARATAFAVVLVLPFGALPWWPYSAGWGCYPSGGLGLGLVLVALLILFLFGRL